MAEADPHFYDRADALIELANAQLAGASRGAVGDSFLYAAARFHAWSSACEQGDAQALAAAKAQLLEAVVAQYRQLLAQHLDDYIAHFGTYLPPQKR